MGFERRAMYESGCGGAVCSSHCLGGCLLGGINKVKYVDGELGLAAFARLQAKPEILVRGAIGRDARLSSVHF